MRPSFGGLLMRELYRNVYEILGRVDFVICGYDPMNMIKMNDKILCSHFIMLKSKDDDNTVFFQGPVMLNLEKGSANRVLSYIR